VLEAVVDFYLGKVVKINVIEPGITHTKTPTIRIAGDGIDALGNQTASAYALLSNKTTRSFDTTLKFDRITYTSPVKQWVASTTFASGDIVSFNGKSFTVKVTTTTLGVFIPDEYTLTVVDNTNNFENSDEYQMTAADRATAFYMPSVGMPPNELARLFHGTEYPGNLVDGNDFGVWAIVKSTAPTSPIIGQCWTQNNTATDVKVWDGTNWILASTLKKVDLMNLIIQVPLSSPPKTHIPKANEVHFTEAEITGIEEDTNIQSFYDDLTLGSKPEDIDVDGGEYVDIFNSHAPEELLPGLIFDTLDIKVFTIDPSDPTNNPMGFRISKTMAVETPAPSVTDMLTLTKTINGISFPAFTVIDGLLTYIAPAAAKDDEVKMTSPVLFAHNDNAWEFRRIAESNTTTLARDLNIGDTTIYVTDVNKLAVPGPGLTRPGIIYINGEKITYYTVDFEFNALGQIRRGVWGTGAPAKHMVESLVVDAGIDQIIPGDATHSTVFNDWTPWDAPSGGNVSRLRAAGTSKTTPQATFIYAKPSYLPWVPGETGIRVDPNVDKTRFDDDGTDEYLTPIHPYDQDPFDSYDAG